MKINRRSVFYNVSVLSFSGVLLQALGFVYQVALSRAAGAQALGIYHLVMPVYSVVSAATVMGIRMAVTTLSARIRSGDLPAIRKLVRKSAGAFLVMFVCTGGPALLLRNFLADKVIQEARTAPALAVLMLCVFLSGFEGIFESLFLGIGNTRNTAISNLLEQGVKIILVLFLLRAFGQAGNYARMAFLIALGMTLSEIPVLVWLSFAYCREIQRQKRINVKSPVGAYRLKVLPVAVPAAVSSALVNLLSAVGTVLLPSRLILSGLTHTEAVSELGVVSEMALPLLLLPAVLVRAMSNVLMPVISNSGARQRYSDVKRKIFKSFQATGILVLPATAILVPLSCPLSRILYRQEIPESYILPLALCAALSCYELIAVSILNGLGRQKDCMVSMTLGEGVTLLCTIFLSSTSLGLQGYLIGLWAGPLFGLVMNLFLIRRHAGVFPRFTESFLIPLLAALTSGGFTRWLYLSMISRYGPGLEPIFLSAVFGASCCLIIFLTVGLNPVRYFKSITVNSKR